MKAMKVLISICLLSILLIGGVALAQTSSYWTFDTNNEGFITGTIDEKNTPWPFMTFTPTQWSATGGLGDGHIFEETIPELNGRLYNIQLEGDPLAPSLGNLYGKTLQTYVMRDQGSFLSPANDGANGIKVLAYWAIGDGDPASAPNCNFWVSKQAYAIDVNALPLGQWVEQSIDFQEANFFPWPNCNNPKTFADLSQSYQYIGFTFLSDQVTPNGNDAWNRYTRVDGVWRLLHYGALSHDNAIFRIDNYGTTDAMIYDFGDLPAYYDTTHAADGARHPIGALRLGTDVQSEPDAHSSADATGDGAEEDGVTRQNGLAGPGWSEGTVADGHGGSLEITISGDSGVPQVFIDFTGANTLTEVTLRDNTGSPIAMPLSPGTYHVYFDIPPGAFSSTDNLIVVRVRLSSTGGLTAKGLAQDGEVEDYMWHFGPNAVTLVNLQAVRSNTAGTSLFLTLLLLTGGAAVLFRQYHV